MKIAIVYGTSHKTTQKIVNKLSQWWRFDYSVFNVADFPNAESLATFDLLVFVCPTYGDEELQEDMERFLVGSDFRLDKVKYVICETGNYYGYDNFSFGAMNIIEDRLLSLGASKYCQGLSLDTLPRVSWHVLERWALSLNEKITHGQ